MRLIGFSAMRTQHQLTHQHLNRMQATRLQLLETTLPRLLTFNLFAISFAGNVNEQTGPGQTRPELSRADQLGQTRLDPG